MLVALLLIQLQVVRALMCNVIRLCSIIGHGQHQVPISTSRQLNAQVGHEASVSSFDETQLFYLASRGIGHQVVRALLINGFVGSFINELPYGVCDRIKSSHYARNGSVNRIDMKQLHDPYVIRISEATQPRTFF